MLRAQSRILINDFAGHPFAIQLSRELARRGYDVRHTYCAGLPGPGGAFETAPNHDNGLAIEAVDIGASHAAGDLVQRRAGELKYGQAIAGLIREWTPNVVISASMPVEAQSQIYSAAGRAGSRFVFWLHECLSNGAPQSLGRKLPGLGHALGIYHRMLEHNCLRGSDAVVAVAQDLVTQVTRIGVDPTRCAVIENWQPLDAIAPRPKDNPWARAHGLADKRVFLYAGTLGPKQDPRVLADLARGFKGDPKVSVTVVSEGPGRALLESVKQDEALDTLDLFDFQPLSALPDVLASGDVLLATLARDAGLSGAPAKMLSAFAAGRPVLLSAPDHHPATQVLGAAGGGFAATPEDRDGFLAAARRLAGSPAERAALGAAGRAYADDRFEIICIANRFEEVIVARGPQQVLQRNVAA